MKTWLAYVVLLLIDRAKVDATLTIVTVAPLRDSAWMFLIHVIAFCMNITLSSFLGMIDPLPWFGK